MRSGFGLAFGFGLAATAFLTGDLLAGAFVLAADFFAGAAVLVDRFVVAFAFTAGAFAFAPVVLLAGALAAFFAGRPFAVPPVEALAFLPRDEAAVDRLDAVFDLAAVFPVAFFLAAVLFDPELFDPVLFDPVLFDPALLDVPRDFDFDALTRTWTSSSLFNPLTPEMPAFLAISDNFFAVSARNSFAVLKLLSPPVVPHNARHSKTQHQKPSIGNAMDFPNENTSNGFGNPIRCR